ncbi:hypothetical protein Dfri01_68810 [Dyadobacter frigoris]|nr:hypothetical protein Dfri01_68810 [Dyadobacter frigoris]
MQRILMSEKETASQYDLIEGTFPPGAQSPLHVHANYSETIIVLEGQVTIYMPGQQHSLKAGESHFITRDVVHCVVNQSETSPFKAIVVASPSGFARLIRSVGICENGTNEPQQSFDMQLAAQVMAEIGDTILGPPGARPE